MPFRSSLCGRDEFLHTCVFTIYGTTRRGRVRSNQYCIFFTCCIVCQRATLLVGVCLAQVHSCIAIRIRIGYCSRRLFRIRYYMYCNGNATLATQRPRSKSVGAARCMHVRAYFAVCAIYQHESRVEHTTNHTMHRITPIRCGLADAQCSMAAQMPSRRVDGQMGNGMRSWITVHGIMAWYV